MERLENIIIPNLEARRDKKSFWFESEADCRGEWHTGKDFLEIIENCEKVLRDAGFSKGQRLVVSCIIVSPLETWRYFLSSQRKSRD